MTPWLSGFLGGFVCAMAAVVIWSQWPSPERWYTNHGERLTGNGVRAAGLRR